MNELHELYYSREDSEFFRQELKKYKGENFLEIGVGQCSNLIDLQPNFSLVAGTDLNLQKQEENGHNLEIFKADRASCFREDSFDVVAFNPPYLPSEAIRDLAVDGGVGGVEVPLAFLQDAKRVLRKDGTILVLLSSESSIPIFREFCGVNNMVPIIVASQKLFFEDLYIFEIRKCELGKPAR